MEAWFAYRDGPVVGPFYVSSRTDVYNRMMDMANAGESPAGRPAEDDMIAVGDRVSRVTSFGFEDVASGPAGRGMVSAWRDGPVVGPGGL